MHATATYATDRSGFGLKALLSIFASDEDRVLTRLDELHKSVPAHLPPARTLFR